MSGVTWDFTVVGFVAAAAFLVGLLIGIWTTPLYYRVEPSIRLKLSAKHNRALAALARREARAHRAVVEHRQRADEAEQQMAAHFAEAVAAIRSLLPPDHPRPTVPGVITSVDGRPV